MAGDIIQCNYDDMHEVSNNFARQSDATRQLMRTVESCLSSLQGGGWLGKGAESFYREMRDLVQPAMQRLGAALSDASSATQRIAAALEQAEREAAALFLGADGGGDGGAGGNSSATGGDAGGGNPDPRYQPVADGNVPAYLINFRDPNFNVTEFMQNLQTDGRPVIFIVHGFTEQNADIVNKLREASRDYSGLYEPGGEGKGKPPIIIGIQWDAGTDSLMPTNYWQANNNARDYGARFADALVQFRQFHPESQVNLIAHSLGNRMVLEGFLANPNARVDNYLAVQAAVDAKEFQPGWFGTNLFEGRFHDVVTGPQIGNMAATYNTQDRALWAHFLTGDRLFSDGDTALGASTSTYPGMRRISLQTSPWNLELNHYSWHDSRVQEIATEYFGLTSPSQGSRPKER